MEQFYHNWIPLLYKTVYIFHMPAFIYLTGYFAKYSVRKLLKHLCLPYFVFQTAYLLFAKYILEENVILQYTTPYWILWYLLVIIEYYLLMPLFPSDNSPKKYLLLTVSLVIALLAGFDTSIGYYMSLARAFTFFPFFLMGYYRLSFVRILLRKQIFKKVHLPLMVSVCMAAAGTVFLIKKDVSSGLLYGSYSYAACEGSPLLRLIIICTAVMWLELLFLLIPKAELPFISVIGHNTMPIFIFHGFCLRLMSHFNLFHFGDFKNMILAICVSVLIMFLFGNPLIKKVFYKIF